MLLLVSMLVIGRVFMVFLVFLLVFIRRLNVVVVFKYVVIIPCTSRDTSRNTN